MKNNRYKSRKLLFTITGIIIHVAVFIYLVRQQQGGAAYPTFVIGLMTLIGIYTGGNIWAKKLHNEETKIDEQGG